MVRRTWIFVIAIITLATPALAFDANRCIQKSITNILQDANYAKTAFDWSSLTAKPVGRGYFKLEETQRDQADQAAMQAVLAQIQKRRKDFADTKVTVNSVKRSRRDTYNVVAGNLTTVKLKNANYIAYVRDNCRFIDIRISAAFGSQALWVWLKEQPAMWPFQKLAAQAVKDGKPYLIGPLAEK